MKTVIREATIRSALLHIDHKGFLTVSLTLNLGKNQYRFFTVPIDSTHTKHSKPKPSIGCYRIVSILRIVDSHTWQGLIGSSIRVKETKDNTITAIGHLTRNEWYPKNTP